MKQYAPVVLDVTHSLQQPNQSSGVTGGRPALVESMAKAGVGRILIPSSPMGGTSTYASKPEEVLALRDVLEKYAEV